MSPETYNALTSILLGSSLVAAALALLFLIGSVIGWNGPHRKSRLCLFVVFLLLFPTLVGAQYFLLYRIYLPLRIAEGDREMLARRQEKYSASTKVAMGDDAPKFSLSDIDGNQFSLDDRTKKVTLINFFATWCGPCQTELPHLQKIWERHGKNDKFSMLVIGREESDETVRAFRSQHEFTFPMAADPDRNVYSLFAEEIIPRVFLISADGKVLYGTMGYDSKELDRVNQLLEDTLR